jgi:hypothetical protein
VSRTALFSSRISAKRRVCLQNEWFIFFVMPEVFLSGIQSVVVRPGSGFRLNTLPE